MYKDRKSGATLKVIGKTEENPFTQKKDNRAEEIKSQFSELFEELMNDAVPFEDKMKSLLRMQSSTVPALIDELESNEPNVDRSTVAYQILKFLKETREIIIKKREVETSEDINPYAPKFQKVFEFFIELIYEVMVSQETSSIEVSNFFTALAVKIAGWEEEVIKHIKGISSKNLNKLSNPFILKFKKQIKDVKEAEEGMYYI